MCFKGLTMWIGGGICRYDKNDTFCASNLCQPTRSNLVAYRTFSKWKLGQVIAAIPDKL